MYAEKDALIINLSKGYVIVVEAKSNLTLKSKDPTTKSPLMKGLDQLNRSYETFLQKAKHLKNDWKVIRIVYGTTMDTKLRRCNNCKPFIITKKDGSFKEVLGKLIAKENFTTKDWTFANDFYKLVSCGKY